MFLSNHTQKCICSIVYQRDPHEPKKRLSINQQYYTTSPSNDWNKALLPKFAIHCDGESFPTLKGNLHIFNWIEASSFQFLGNMLLLNSFDVFHGKSIVLMTKISPTSEYLAIHSLLPQSPQHHGVYHFILTLSMLLIFWVFQQLKVVLYLSRKYKWKKKNTLIW